MIISETLRGDHHKVGKSTEEWELYLHRKVAMRGIRTRREVEKGRKKEKKKRRKRDRIK